MHHRKRLYHDYPRSVNQSMFYFMSVHIEVILEGKKKRNTHTQNNKKHIYFYTKYQLTHRTIKKLSKTKLVFIDCP